MNNLFFDSFDRFDLIPNKKEKKKRMKEYKIGLYVSDLTIN